MPIHKILEQSDKKFVIGIDEVGYGCIAGPIYVCAFLAPKDWSMDGVKDSKDLAEKKRKLLCEELTCIDGVDYAVEGVHTNSDEYKEYGTNAHGALKFLYWKAARRVIEDFSKESFEDFIREQALIVLDGNIKFPEHPYSLGESISLPKADALIQQVSAASIIAKVHRDSWMVHLSKKFPNYSWENNKGYPSKSHLQAIKKYGVCDEHRAAYEPIKTILKSINKHL